MHQRSDHCFWSFLLSSHSLSVQLQILYFYRGKGCLETKVKLQRSQKKYSLFIFLSPLWTTSVGNFCHPPPLLLHFYVTITAYKWSEKLTKLNPFGGSHDTNNITIIARSTSRWPNHRTIEKRQLMKEQKLKIGICSGIKSFGCKKMHLRGGTGTEWMKGGEEYGDRKCKN